MNIILKNSLKNIFFKPFRTILVVFSIFVCSVCAMLCFDLASSIKTLIANLYGGISKAEIMFSADDYSAKGLPDGFPESEMMELNSNADKIFNEIEGEYAFVTQTTLRILGVNLDEAVSMEFMDPIEIGYMEAAVTSNLATKYGYDVGDKMIIHDRSGDPVELTVSQILPADNKNYLISGNTVLLNMETAEVISCGKTDRGILLIDVLDNSKVDEAKKMLEDYYPNGTVTLLSVSEDDMEGINEITSLLYLLFAITFLLVIFVTSSICNRIVSERMSFIGTLRSLGMSTARTGRILLLENVIFAVLGSVPGIAVYSLIRSAILNMLFYTTDSEGNVMEVDIPPMSVILIAGVILGAVLVECLIPLRAILKALHTSIRDIIFDNRDTEYKYNKVTLVIGLTLFVGAVVSFFFRKTLPGATVCLVCTVVSLACLFPWIFKGAAGLIERLAAKKENAGLSLAVREAVSRKSTVSSGILCVTSAAMCVIVFAFAQSLMTMISQNDYDCDVIVFAYEKMKKCSFIDKLESVTDTEAVYLDSTYISINDEEKETWGGFYAMPENGYKYYNFFADLPDSLDDGCIIADDRIAEKKGLNEGDTIKITYNPDGVFPIEREYRIAKLVKVKSFDGESGSFIITPKEFKEIFRDTIGYYLVKCDDPDYVAETIRTYTANTFADVYAMDEYLAENAQDATKLIAIITAIIVLASGMTFIGMVSNQLLGFEGRKKECAVMLSTAMGRGKLSGVLFMEMLITSFTASCLGTIAGVILSGVIGAATENSQSVYLVMETDPVKNILFCIILIIIFTGTVLFPIRKMKKMKISEQLKYE